MRRALLAAALTVLCALVGARATLSPLVREEDAQRVWDAERYNVLDLAAPAASQTAGSALIGDLDRYYLGRTPTEKNVYTGRLAGKNLILILAEEWTVPSLGDDAPAARRLWSEGARFREYFAPDWYQGMDGREFALLAGTVPTAVEDEPAMVWIGHADVQMRQALAQCLSREGYTCQVRAGRRGLEGAYAALGFESVKLAGDPAEDLTVLADRQPFFAYYALDSDDPEPVLESLLATLEARGMAGDTAICVAAGHEDPLRGHLFLWADGMAGAEAGAPCSELDAAATLLNLFGAAYDSRLLSGRDVFAPREAGAGEQDPLVILYGSAYSDWVTDRGNYAAAQERFFPAEGAFSGRSEARRYAAQMCRRVYDSYIYARRAVENDYFRLAAER